MNQFRTSVTRRVHRRSASVRPSRPRNRSMSRLHLQELLLGVLVAVVAGQRRRRCRPRRSARNSRISGVRACGSGSSRM